MKTHIDFIIDWYEILKTLGWISLGIFISFLIICFIFRNFRLY